MVLVNDLRLWHCGLIGSFVVVAVVVDVVVVNGDWEEKIDTRWKGGKKREHVYCFFLSLFNNNNTSISNCMRLKTSDFK